MYSQYLTSRSIPIPGTVCLECSSDRSSSRMLARSRVSMSDYLIQYLVLRKDLLPSKGDKKKSGTWNLGACMAQAAHVSLAAVGESLERPETREYIAPENVDRMAKCVLGVDDEEGLRSLARDLEGKISFKLWVEQPENVATAFASAPGRKQDLEQHFKHLKLLR